MRTKTFAIGDIHGSYDELYSLMTKLISEHNLNATRDTVIFLGDYIDRGLKSRQVLETLIGWKEKYPHWHFLMGNHEHMFLEDMILQTSTYQKGLWVYNGGDKTLNSYEDDLIPNEHVEFMNTLEKFYEDENYFYCHAGLLPSHTLEENKQLPLRTFLWIREEFLEKDFDFGKKIIYGHTGNRYDLGQPIIREHSIGIDGAPCPPANRNLLAIELPSEKVIRQHTLK